MSVSVSVRGEQHRHVSAHMHVHVRACPGRACLRAVRQQPSVPSPAVSSAHAKQRPVCQARGHLWPRA